MPTYGQMDNARRFGQTHAEYNAARDQQKAQRFAQKQQYERSVANTHGQAILKQAVEYNQTGEDIDREGEIHLSDGRTWRDTGLSVMHELTKSYGIRHDFETGDWSWSMDNMAKSWESALATARKKR